MILFKKSAVAFYPLTFYTKIVLNTQDLHFNKKNKHIYETKN